MRSTTVQRLGRVLLAATLLMLTPAAAGEAVFCETEAVPVPGGGISPHKRCIAGRFPEFVDYDFNIPSCTLVIRMRNVEDPLALGEEMRPGFSQYTEGMPSPPCPADGSAVFRFEAVDAYPYRELLEWADVVEPTVRNIEQFRSMSIMDGRLHFYLGTESGAAKVVSLLQETGVPEDAYDVGSWERDVRDIASIAPTLRESEQGGELLLPLVAGISKVGDLVLGRTTRSEVTALLPPWLGEEPVEQRVAPRSKRAPWISKKAHRVLEQVRVTYGPTPAYLFMGFDQSERLIFASYEVREGQEESLSSGLSSLADLEEVHRSGWQIVERGHVGPCVIVEAGLARRADGRFRLCQATYFYTCGTAR